MEVSDELHATPIHFFFFSIKNKRRKWEISSVSRTIYVKAFLLENWTIVFFPLARSLKKERSTAWSTRIGEPSAVRAQTTSDDQLFVREKFAKWNVRDFQQLQVRSSVATAQSPVNPFPSISFHISARGIYVVAVVALKKRGKQNY